VLLLKELHWALSEITDMANYPIKIVVIFTTNFHENFGIGIRIRMKYIVFFLGVLVFTENEVDPKVNIFTNIVTLQSSP
jgi:hypothetical protein